MLVLNGAQTLCSEEQALVLLQDGVGEGYLVSASQGGKHLHHRGEAHLNTHTAQYLHSGVFKARLESLSPSRDLGGK